MTKASDSTIVAVPDGGTVTRTLEVTGAGPYIADVDLVTRLRHSWSDDIDMTLTAPDGTVVTLTTDNGWRHRDVFADTRWDDDANPGGTAPYTTDVPAHGHNFGLAQDHPYEDGVAVPALAPEEPLGSFISKPANGTWTLTIHDDTLVDTGTLDAWELEITTLKEPSERWAHPEVAVSPQHAIGTGGGDETVSSQLEVAGLPRYLDDVNVFTDVTHRYSSRLQVTLTSPAGTTVTLVSNPRNEATGTGELRDVFAGTFWDDNADPDGELPYTTNDHLAADHPYVNGELAMHLAPTEGLAAFTGEDPNGTWTLRVADRLPGEGGMLKRWALGLHTARCAEEPAPPEPKGDAPPSDPSPAPRDEPAPVPEAGEAGGPPPSTEIAAPVIGSFTAQPRKVLAGRSVRLKWRLSKAATVTVVVERLGRGSARKIGTIKRNARAGKGSLKLKGSVGKRKLTPGRYRATITAVAGGSQASAPRRASFTVRRARRR